MRLSQSVRIVPAPAAFMPASATDGRYSGEGTFRLNEAHRDAVLTLRHDPRLGDSRLALKSDFERGEEKRALELTTEGGWVVGERVKIFVFFILVIGGGHTILIRRVSLHNSFIV
jgi:hypothetical protein